MDSTRKSVVIAIDIGATKTRMAYSSEKGVTCIFHQSTPQDPIRALDMIENGIRDARLPGALAGVSIGCPGPLDPAKGVIFSPPNLRQWADFRIVSLLERRLHVEVRLENDANAGALGEALFGCAKDCRHVFYMTISTGIGAGIVIDKEIYRGSHGLAGEIWAVKPRQARANTGIGCDSILDIASGNGLVKQVLQQMAKGRETIIPQSNVTTASIIAAWEKNDPLATDVMRIAHETLGEALCFVASLLDPDIIVLGGGLCMKARWMVEPIRDYMRRGLAIDALSKTRVRRARLWDDAVLHGALGLFQSALH